MRNDVVGMGIGLALLAACRDRPAPVPVVADIPDPTVPAPAASSPAAPPDPTETIRAVVEVLRADDGSADAATQAAVPLLCHDGEGWVAKREVCISRLGKGVRVVSRAGAWRTTGEVTTIFDREYQGLVLESGAQDGLAFSGFAAAPAERCRSIQAPDLALDEETWAQLSTALPHRAAFAAGYPGNVRHREAFAADFDGDGDEDVLVSITVEEDVGRLDLVMLQVEEDVRVLGHEWSMGDSFGGEPERRLVDIRSLSCFELDGRPGLEFVASLRGETEREHQAASFAGAVLLPVGDSVFFGD